MHAIETIGDTFGDFILVSKYSPWVFCFTSSGFMLLDDSNVFTANRLAYALAMGFMSGWVFWFFSIMFLPPILNFVGSLIVSLMKMKWDMRWLLFLPSPFLFFLPSSPFHNHFIGSLVLALPVWGLVGSVVSLVLLFLLSVALILQILCLFYLKQLDKFLKHFHEWF